MSLVFCTACFVVCLVLAAGWFDEFSRHGFTKAKLECALNDVFPEFDVAPEDHA